MTINQLHTNSTQKTLGVFTQPLHNNPFVEHHFNSTQKILNPADKHAELIDIVVGWGRKPKALTASNFAQKNNLPFVTLEDGFIHSMSQGRLGASSWSLVVDDLGIFYDANTPSSLEKLINTTVLSCSQISRARHCLEAITQNCITKYNNAKLIIPESIKKLNNTILVIDQVEGDMSIPYSLADGNSFNAMLMAAIDENPNSDILIKTHPDVINGKRKGCIVLPDNLPKNVYVSSDNLNPLSLLKYICKVYVVSSQTGFEALLMGKSVVCFGAPFYAGWGLTDDRLPKTLDVFKRRKSSPTITTIFYAAYFSYSNYLHPDTNTTCELEDILEYVKLQYNINKKHIGKIYCIGFSPWKKKFIKAYLKSPDNEVLFAKNSAHARQLGYDASSKTCLWSSRHEAEASKLHAEFHTPIWKIEDGFLRSVSLGSNYALPSSLVIDKQGIYFDPQKPSDLETILLETNFSDSQTQLAEKLKTQLIKQDISKYNVGVRDIKDLFCSAGTKRKLLVPGQVADDSSILKGCREINTNLDLLRTVRDQNPEAYIIYKPHPDVLSRNRKGHIDHHELIPVCDEVIYDISITSCLNQVDEVHTMTSLVGFEGLIRELKVHCYGIPFYSGWGLTVDYYHCERRTRNLSLNELIAGTLICYPTYMNWVTQNYTTATQVSNTIHAELMELQKAGKNPSALPPRSWRWARKKVQLLKTLLQLTNK